MTDPARREFLRISAAAAGLGWMPVSLPVLLSVGQSGCDARDKGLPLEHLPADIGRSVAAIAEQIIPSGDTPGANDAGVVYFIDQALGGFMAGALQFVIDGTRELDAAPGKPGVIFADLNGEQQRALIEAREDTPFFSTMHFLTIAGMFSMPAHGGNRNHAGWELLGFDHRHGWEPPFGYYDDENADE